MPLSRRYLLIVFGVILYASRTWRANHSCAAPLREGKRAMADLNALNDLQISVRSKILEQIQSSLERSEGLTGTSYVKSDGTNYGMYTKSDPNLTDLWDTVINQNQRLVVAPVSAPGKQPGPTG